MADLTIKPQAGTGNKLIIQDQAGTARVTTSDAGIDIPAVTGNFAAAGNDTSTGNLTVSGDFVPSAPLSNRNIIINGAMQVAQRGNGPATATGSAGWYQTADRMNDFDNCVAANVTRETTNGVLGTETGNTFNDVFPYSWKWASNGTVSSIPASDRVIFRYRIEGQDVQHLAKGTSVAKAVTLSFWIKSSLTGNLQVNLCDRTNTRHIGATYTISAANTWEKKVITFAGDTTGALTNDTANQLELEWWLTSGTTYSGGGVPTTWRTNNANERDQGTIDYVGGSGRTWQITGIQLELGSNVTPFEHRSFGDELKRCERYYETIYDADEAVSDEARIGTGVFWKGDQLQVIAPFRTRKRAVPTFEEIEGTNYYKADRYNSEKLIGAVGSDSNGNTLDRFSIWISGGGFSDSIGAVWEMRTNNVNARGAFSAEL